jgi:peptidoglycan/LPS O-acetylase OafA/YrhL
VKVTEEAPDCTRPDLVARGPDGGPKFYANLESLRGICAMIVVLLHVPWTWHFQHSPVIQGGWLFVDFFFVLSGFVIGVAHGVSDRSGTMMRRFIIKRFFRLYPLHIVTLVAAAALIAARYVVDPVGTVAGYRLNTEWVWLFLANVCLVHSWGVTGDAILNTPSWSISTEFGAYLLFGAVCMLVSGKRSRTIAMLAASALALLLLVLFRDASLDGDIRFRLARCIYSFGLGILTWYIVSHARAQIGGATATVIQLSLSAVVVVMLFLINRTTQLTLLMPGLFAALIIAMALDRGSVAKRFIELPPLLLLGRLSYSIYLTHGIVLTSIAVVVNRVFATRAPDGRTFTGLWVGDLILLVAIGVTIVVSLITERWVERPWRRYGREVAARHGLTPDKADERERVAV